MLQATKCRPLSTNSVTLLDESVGGLAADWSSYLSITTSPDVEGLRVQQSHEMQAWVAQNGWDHKAYHEKVKAEFE